MSIEWTHKEVEIKDIRKVKKFYVLNVDDEEITSPLFVDHNIFDGRMKSFYLKDIVEFSREEVLNVKWNMVITKGYFWKIDKENKEEKIEKDSEKFYISFLEIEGPLGNHVPG